MTYPTQDAPQLLPIGGDATAAPATTTPSRFGPQLADLRLTVLTCAVLIAVTAVVGIALSRAFGIGLYDITADPAAATHRPFATGMVSFLGIMGWGAAAASAFVGAAILYRVDPWSERARMLALAGALSAALGIDDALMLHEEALPRYLLVPEIATYGFYATVAVAFLRAAWPFLRRTDYLLLLAAGGAMAASIASDQLLPFNGKITFVEDMAKFSGIVLWVAYLLRTVRLLVTDSIEERIARVRAR